jgi:hypothetical protein
MQTKVKVQTVPYISTAKAGSFTEHLVNHGTDHRSTVLQKLTEFGAPTFDQDFIIWMWSRK